MSSKQKGQSLLELIISLAIAILVLGALAFAVITSLRNAQLAKNQTQATKLAQEALETIRSLRDRNGSVDNGNFNDLWNTQLRCADGSCYFILNAGNGLSHRNSAVFENIAPNFTRQIQIEDVSDGTTQKQITAIVQWTDTTGIHKSQLTTILGKTL